VVAIGGDVAKLTANQWDDIEKRLSNGERASDLAKTFGITRQTLHARFKDPNEKQVVALATQIFELETNLKKTDKNLQVRARSLADRMAEINDNMVEGNTHCAKSYAKLSEIAYHHIKKIDHENPNFETLQLVAGITKVGNGVAAPINAMLAAHKEKLQEGPEDAIGITEIRRTFIGSNNA
jgi:hypothetical protein